MSQIVINKMQSLSRQLFEKGIALSKTGMTIYGDGKDGNPIQAVAEAYIESSVRITKDLAAFLPEMTEGR